MVDTARTKAEIMALLANNASYDISPQDLRDALESIVNPAVGSGFPRLPSSEERFMFYSISNPAVSVIQGAASADPSELLLNQASARAQDGYFSDESGWVNDEVIPTIVDWAGHTDGIPIGRALVLPRGTYWVSFYVDLNGVHTPSDNVILSWYSAIEPVSDVLGKPPFYTPGFPGYATGMRRGDTFQCAGLLAHFDADPLPFTFALSAAPVNATLDISDYGLFVAKINDVL